MPVKPRKDSFSISFEVKYISHGGGIGKPDELIQYPAPDEVRGQVQRLLQVVRDKKTKIKEAVFDSIELNLQSIDVKIQNLKDPKQVTASSAKEFLTELREREKYVHNCMTEAESCCCFETSKPWFLEKELQEFNECLKSFNRKLEAEAKNSMKKTVSGTVDNSLRISETITKFPPSLPAPAIQEQKEELTRSNAMPKTSETSSSAVNKTPNSDYSSQSISPKAKGQTEQHQCSNPTQKREVKQQHVAHSSISSNTSRDAQPSKLSHSGISSNTSGDVQQSKLSHSGISSNTTGDAKPSKLSHSGISSNRTGDVQPSKLSHSGISSNRTGDVQPSKLSHSGISSNRTGDVQPSKLSYSSISSNTSGDMQPNNFTQSISSNKPRETNKERDAASVPNLKASGFAAGMQAWSVFNDKEDPPPAIQDSAKTPKLKEIEPIQQQTKPATVVNLKMEITHSQPYPAGSEIEPIQLQIKPAPVKNLKKESIQLQSNPPEADMEPIQRQNYPTDRGRRFQ